MFSKNAQKSGLGLKWDLFHSKNFIVLSIFSAEDSCKTRRRTGYGESKATHNGTRRKRQKRLHKRPMYVNYN